MRNNVRSFPKSYSLSKESARVLLEGCKNTRANNGKISRISLKISGEVRGLFPVMLVATQNAIGNLVHSLLRILLDHILMH